MKVGVCEAPELKKQGEKLQLSFADALYGYMIEDVMLRIFGSDYREYLWLTSKNVLGTEAYRNRSEKQIGFLYQPAARRIAPEKLCPGQKLSVALCKHMMLELLGGDNAQQISWSGEVTEKEESFYLHLTGTYRQMQVPLCIVIRSVQTENQRPEQKEIHLSVIENRHLSYLVYAPENLLSRDLFEIVNKLELIGDMGCYDRVYQTLLHDSLSGRYVLEELSGLSEACPQVSKEFRLTQLAEYESYAYMRKRWEKYVRGHGGETVAWADVLHLVLAFLAPIWRSLCNNEIFFDDWMPELRRFLG